MANFFLIISYISFILLIILTVLSLIKYKQVDQNEKWYIYYITLIFFVELISYIIPYTKIKTNAFMYPVYIAGEFFTITGIFIEKLKLSKYYFIVTGILSLFFLTADRILIQQQYNNDYSKAVSNLIMISLIAYSLIQNIKITKGRNRFLMLDKMFFFYFLVSIFIFMLQNQLISLSIDIFYSIWIINNLMVVLLYSLFIKTFLQLKK